jgi:anaerobic selenocysteine-containing dehydrogenase
MHDHPGVCPLDCPDRCSLKLTVDSGRLSKIAGSRENPLTAGFICSKVQEFDSRIYGPHRILHPMVRSGPKGSGQFRQISWEEAIRLIAERFQEILDKDGGEAILPCWYGGSNGYLTAGGMDARFWHRLGAARMQRTLCAVNAGMGARSVYADLPATDTLDVAEAGLVILWGMNPTASGIHLLPLLKKVREKGGQLVVVDPRQIPVSVHAAQTLKLLPGTDIALAMALHHIAFRDGLADLDFLGKYSEPEEIAALQQAAAEWSPERAAAICGIAAGEIEELAKRYAEAPKALLRCGWGLERNRNGTDSVRAVLALPAVYGKFKGRGSGYMASASGGYKADLAPIQRTQNGHYPARTVNQSQLAQVIETVKDPPIRAVYVYNCNPVATVPDQKQVIAALSREDLFVVVHEQVWNDSTDVADIVLPATTFVEHEEFSRSYGGYILQWSKPAIEPVGEARSNHDVFQDLSRALGFTDPELYQSPEALVRQFTNAIPAAKGQELVPGKPLLLPRPIQFIDCFPSRKLSFTKDETGKYIGPPRYREAPCDADAPFILISPADARSITSTGFDNLPEGSAEVLIHPEDARHYGVEAGAAVRLWNSVGELHIRALISTEVRRGVLSLPKGLWRKSTLNGFTSNALVPAHVDEIAGGACYNDARVYLSPL